MCFRGDFTIKIVCSTPLLAPRIGLYTASLVSLKDTLIGWSAADYDAPIQLWRIQINTGYTLPSPTWRALPTWRKQKAFPLPGTAALWVFWKSREFPAFFRGRGQSYARRHGTWNSLPLRQWLVSYAKTRFKMCHTFKHLFICNTFCCRLILLSLSLYTELALVCCTNPNNVNCFGTIFPNLNFVFASNLSRPPGPYWIRPIQKLLNCQTRTRCQCYSIHPDWGATKNSAVALGLRNNIISIHLMSARTNEDKTTLI